VRAGTFVQSGAALTFCPRTRERAAGYNGESTGVHENFAEIFAKKNAKNFARKKIRNATLNFRKNAGGASGAGSGAGGVAASGAGGVGALLCGLKKRRQSRARAGKIFLPVAILIFRGNRKSKNRGVWANSSVPGRVVVRSGSWPLFFFPL